MVEKKEGLYELEKLKIENQLKESLKECEKLREKVVQLEEEKRVLFDKNLKIQERYNKIISELVSHMEDEMGKKLDGHVSNIKKMLLDLEADTPFQASADKCKRGEKTKTKGPFLINLAHGNGNPSRNSLACEAGVCIKNNLNEVSHQPGSSPVILVMDDNDGMAYASKSSGLGGNLTSPQINEVCAKDSSSLMPKRKRSMNEGENNDNSSSGRQKTIPIQELVNDGKRPFVGDNSSTPEHSSKLARAIPSPEQNLAFTRLCEDKSGTCTLSRQQISENDLSKGFSYSGSQILEKSSMDDFEKSMLGTTLEVILKSNSKGLVDLEPKLGYEFDSNESAITFYNEYARRLGFSVRKEYVNTNKNLGYVTSRKITCFKEGFRGADRRRNQVKNPRKETRTGCNAHIIITRQSNGKYHLTKVELEHNHPLVPPTMVHMLPSHRRINEVQAHKVDLTEDTGLFPKATSDFMGLRGGGRESLGYTKLNQKNYLQTKRQKAVKQGEAGALIEYFEKKKIEDPSFFFAVQLDADDMVTNIFWTDSKMIIDYESFGDVLAFDTTYKKNREHRPLASFVGLNNHRKMVIFGGALMYNETLYSFRWLFETFIRAMSGKKPKTIFTDQDDAMTKAIALIMPEVHHRLSAWHMEQNATTHLNQICKSITALEKYMIDRESGSR